MEENEQLDVTNQAEQAGKKWNKKMRLDNVRGALDSIERILDTTVPSGKVRSQVQIHLDAVWHLVNDLIEKDFTDV